MSFVRSGEREEGRRTRGRKAEQAMGTQLPGPFKRIKSAKHLPFPLEGGEKRGERATCHKQNARE